MDHNSPMWPAEDSREGEQIPLLNDNVSIRPCNAGTSTSSLSSSTAKVGGATYVAMVLLIGISLEVVRLLQATHSDLSYCGNDNGTVCFIASQVMGVDDFSVQLFSISCMVLAIAWVIGDFTVCQRFRFREKLLVSNLGYKFDRIRGLTYVTTCRMARLATVWAVVSFGTLAMVQAFLQCIAGYALDTCWTTTGRVYHVVRSLFITLIVVYICLLMMWNVAVFSKSFYNVFMAHHVVATCLYMSIRTVIEAKSFLEYFDILSSSTENSSLRQSNVTVCTCYLSTGTSWVTKAYANENFQILSSTVVLLFLMFVSFYLDVWTTAQTDPNSRLMNSRRLEIESDDAENVTERLQIVSNEIAVATSFVVVLGIAGSSVVGYLDLISIRDLLFIQLSRLLVALIATFLAVSGLVIVRQNLKIDRIFGYMEILLLTVFVGALLDKTVNIIVCSFSLYNSSTVQAESVIGIIEQLTLLIQAVLQTTFIIIASQREGRFANGCCGLARVPNVTYLLAVLNWGMSQLLQH